MGGQYADPVSEEVRTPVIERRGTAVLDEIALAGMDAGTSLARRLRGADASARACALTAAACGCALRPGRSDGPGGPSRCAGARLAGCRLTADSRRGPRRRAAGARRRSLPRDARGRARGAGRRPLGARRGAADASGRAAVLRAHGRPRSGAAGARCRRLPRNAGRRPLSARRRAADTGGRAAVLRAH